MHIYKLHLRAFGKFVSKKLYLENRLNIVYGENETGKSTIHNFIEAMLYGFDDENSSRFEKYRPWNSNLYKGTLGVRNNNNEQFTLSRDFLLNTLQVYKKTDDDKEFEEDILNPGEYLLNMSKVSFTNTISVRQLGNKTDEELANELKNKIINLSKTRDESISIDRILQRLLYIKEEAGNENNQRTLLGQYSLRLNELKVARENSINAKRQLMFLAMEKKKLSGKIGELSLRVNEMQKEINDYELSIKKDTFLKAEPVKRELDEIKKQLTSINVENIIKYSEQDYKEAIRINSFLTSMYSDRRSMQNEKEDKEEELNNLLSDVSNKISDIFNIEQLNANYEKLKSNLDRIKVLESKIKVGQENIDSINIDEISSFFASYESMEDIDRKIETNNIFLSNEVYEKISRYKTAQKRNVFILTLLAAAAIGVTWWTGIEYESIIKEFIDKYYVMEESVYIGAGIVSILVAILYAIVIKPYLNKIKSAKNEIDSMECEFANYTLLLKDLNNEKDEILKQIKCDDLSQIAEKHNKLSVDKNIYEEKSKLINFDKNQFSLLEQENADLKRNLRKALATLDMEEICDENIKEANEAYLRKDNVKEEISKLKFAIEKLKQEIVKIDKEASFEEKRLGMILTNNGMEDLESFKKAVAYSDKYTELTNNKNYKESILFKILDNVDYDELNSITKNISFYEVKKIDKQEQLLNIFKLNEEKLKLNENIDAILKEIDDIENNSRNLAEIEEEIDFYENKILSFKSKIKVAEIAAQKIIKISDSIKGDFMPLLRKSISDNFSYLTNGKYSDVVIDEDMNITVVEAENKDRNINLEHLSGGTLDQLYLSLRVGLGNILSGNKNIPLIFDDSFVQYDSKRLRNSIDMLAKESERRQVILFTCQEREKEMAQQMNIKHNYIKL